MAHLHTDSMSALDAGQALEQLLAGNRRYIADASLHSHQSAERRVEVATGQHPFAVIIGCSDSRVPPEVIFDCGLGDLFVIRVAGNVITDVVLGSVEYAVEHLGVRLVVVLGHGRCGAVSAAVQGGHAPGHIGSLVERIRPAVEQAAGHPGDYVDNAIHYNTCMAVAELILSQPILDGLVAEGRVSVVGARYDLESGQVKLIADAKV